MAPTKRKRLAPKGLAGAANAAEFLSGRYGDDDEAETEPPAPAATETPTPADPAKASPPKPSSGDAKGMTRRTYYLAEADADALEDAVARIHKTMRGLIPKHRILGAIIAGGLDNLEIITQRLKDELLAGLN